MNYPYSTSTGSIFPILEKIQNVGQPKKVNKTWLSSIGYTKASEQRILGILKFLNFAEKSGIPTDHWQKFRSHKEGKKVLANAIKVAYSELFEIYPNAQDLSNDELKHFFSTRTTAGELALKHTVNTFNKLAQFADFNNINSEAKTEKTKDEKKSAAEPKSEESTTSIKDQFSRKLNDSPNGLTVNLNIQLTVPETTDEKVYDKFFESMKKHLLS